MKESYYLKVKVCLVGDPFVGKTCLARRYIIDIFNDKYHSTLGTKISKKLILIKKKNKDIHLTLSLWDILGNREFPKIFAMALKGASGAMLVCDITQKETIKNIFSWAAQINRLNGEIPVIILANKCDLTKDCAMTDAELEHFVSELNVPFFKTSAKNGDNVIKIFYKLADMVIDKIFLAADEKTGARVYLNS